MMGVRNLGSLLKPVTLRGQVEGYLREAIVSGRFKPGERLVERELCAHMRISRPSLREAFRLLEAERLIQHTPHRGPVVASVTMQEARDLYAIRALLEGYAAQEFTRLADDAAKAQLASAVCGLRAAAVAGSTSDLLQAKSRFYDILFSHCGNELLQRICQNEMQRVSQLRATSLTGPDRLPRSLEEIESLLTAVLAGDAAKARAIAYDHVKNAEQSALAVLAGQTDSSRPTHGAVSHDA